MKETLQILIASLGMAGLLACTQRANGDGGEAYAKAEREMREYVPKLERLETEYPEDAEIQLGLGVLYAKYAPSKRFSDKVEERWREVLRIEPGNKAAMAVSVKRLSRATTARRASLFNWLERGIENATRRNLQELKLPRRSVLYSFFKKDDTEGLITLDFEVARRQLREILDKELPLAMDAVNEGEKADPNNALYNYLRAHLLFELGEKEEALKEVRNAVGKKYLNTYFTETRSAVARVLSEGGFPENLRAKITDVYSPLGDFLRGEIWKKQFVPMIEKYEEEGNVEGVRDICALLVGMAKHVREEPMPYESLFNQSFSDGVDKWVLKRTNEISVKSSIGERGISRTAKYTLLAALCGVLVGYLILIRRRRGRNRDR